MTDLSNYALSLLREGDFTLFRGRCDGQIPIMVVAVRQRSQSAESIKRLEHEYTLRDELDLAWAARPVGRSSATHSSFLRTCWPSMPPSERWGAVELIAAGIGRGGSSLLP